MAEEKPKYESQIKNLLDNEFAFYAANQSDNPAYALAGLREFYSGRVKGFDKDPLFAQIFEECGIGIGQGVKGIAHSGLRNAMISYSNQYQKAMAKINVAEFMKYAESRGYKDVPAKLKELFEKYATKTVEELAKSVKENKDEEAKKVIQAIESIKNYICQGRLNEIVSKKATGKDLESIVAEKD